MYSATSGSPVVVKESFLSRSNTPLLPNVNDLPLVALFSPNRTVLYKAIATSGNVPGEWTATLQVPQIKVTDHTELPVLWRFVADDGDKITVRDAVVVSPSDVRDSESVITVEDTEFTARVPFRVSYNTVKALLYKDNKVLSTWTNNTDLEIITANSYTSTIKFVIPDMSVLTDVGSLVPYTLVISDTAAANKSTSWLYVVNASILSATMMLSEFVNKARVKNVIPELDFTTSDLLLYLWRGLNMFNALPPMVTGFTGTAMSGALLDAWIACSSHCLLSAQIQAEGASAFNFSGQSVTFDVDRTGFIESALGRLDATIDNTVKPFKKQLVKAGATGGPGNISTSALTYGRAFGRVFLTNNPISMRNRYGGSILGGNVVMPLPFIRRGSF